MSPVREVLTVASREFIERARSRAFLVSTIATAMVAAALLALPSLIDERIEQVELAATPEAAPLEAAVESIAEERDLRLAIRRVITEEDIAFALADGDIDVVLIGPTEVLVESSLRQSPGLELATAAYRLIVLREAADAVGVDDDQLGGLLASELTVEAVGLASGGDESRSSLATGGLILTYMAILLYGAWTLMGVTEEKTSRVVELILATIRPRRLLAGKVVGIGSLAVTQMLVIVVVLLTVGSAIGVIGSGEASGVDLSSVPWDVVGMLLLWFITGFALYNAMFSAVGSLISRIEDAQSVNLPVALGVVVSVAVSFFVLERPRSPIGDIATFVPFSAPFVAPVRYALGVLPTWQLVVAFIITVLFTWLMVRVAGRIYQGAILRVGGKVSLRDAWRGLD